MLEKHGVRIAAISYDAREILAEFAQKYLIGYPLLSDSGSDTIRSFGIFNYNMAPELRAHGVPHPVEYLVLPDGIVAKKYFVPNYMHRVTASAVALREFGEAGEHAASVRFESGPLAVQIGLASARAFAGQEVSFFAKFVLLPGWHVYGEPLPEGFTSMAVLFECAEAMHQTFRLPAPSIIEFPLLRESLPVYEGAFEGLGTLLLKHPLPEGELTLRGSVRFQTCSQTICEPPQALGFELGLTLEPFVVSDRDREVLEQKQRDPSPAG